MSEVQSFKSMYEANEYIRRHETATNSKFVKFKKSKHFDMIDVKSLDSYRCRLTTKNSSYINNEEMAALMNDWIPYIQMGGEERLCQFGPHFRKSTPKSTDGTPRKRKTLRPSKKVDCPARIKIKKHLKFPDYLIPEDKRSDYSIRQTLSRLRNEFGEQTKRYIQIYVLIDHEHCHEDYRLLKNFKLKTPHSKIDKGCTRTFDTDIQMFVPETAPVLKRLATLKGKDLSDVKLQFKASNELPRLLARPKAHQKLEDIEDNQLVLLYYDLTGNVPNEMFADCNKQFTRENLLLLLHLCIVFANAAGNEQTHPSVRIKGTEYEFTPVQCMEADCPIVDVHMHCPFCAMTDSYSDAGMLKAHYTKQHINKALEFSGLKILRCYDTCEVASAHLDCKTFKGGHWHCYKCSGAINGRCNALEHYKIHLREYESSFLVHVAQDVNLSLSSGTLVHEIGNVYSSRIQYDPPVADPMETLTATKYVSGESHVGNPYNSQSMDSSTVLYVEEDEMGNVMSSYTAQEVVTSSGNERVVVSYADTPDVAKLKAKIQELEMKNKKLERDNVLQKSLIGFLEKKNTDQAANFNAEKEKLMEEIAMLKGSETIIEDTHEVYIDRAEHTPVRTQMSNTRAAVKIETDSSYDKSPVSNNTSNELLSLKKDIADLKNVLYTKVNSAPGLGQISGIQKSPQLFFIPNQRILNPGQPIFPQQFTGVPNVSQPNVLTNIGAVNFPLKVPQVNSNASLANTTVPLKNVEDKSDEAKLSENQHEDETVDDTTNLDSSNAEVSKDGEAVDTSTDNEVVEGDLDSSLEDNDEIMDTLGETACSTSVTSTCNEATEKSDKGVSGASTEIYASETDTETLKRNLENTETFESNVGTSISFPNNTHPPGTLLPSSMKSVGTENSSAVLKNANAETEANLKDLANKETPIRSEETPTSQSEITSAIPSVTKSALKVMQSSPSVMETEMYTAVTLSLSNTSETCTASKSNTLETVATSSGNSSIGGVMNMPPVGIQNPAPLLLVPNQRFMSPFAAPQNITGFTNSPLVNPFQTLGGINPYSFNPQGVQNSAPLVFVPNLGGASPFIIPGSNMLGVGAFPGLGPQTVMNVSLNNCAKLSSGTQVTASSSAATPSTSTSSNIVTSSKLAPTVTSPQSSMSQDNNSTEIENSSENKTITLKNANTGQVTVVRLESEKSNSPQKRKFLSLAKSSGNEEYVEKELAEVLKKAKTTVSSNDEAKVSGLDKKPERKGQIILLSAKIQKDSAKPSKGDSVHNVDSGKEVENVKQIVTKSIHSKDSAKPLDRDSNVEVAACKVAEDLKKMVTRSAHNKSPTKPSVDGPSHKIDGGKAVEDAKKMVTRSSRGKDSFKAPVEDSSVHVTRSKVVEGKEKKTKSPQVKVSETIYVGEKKVVLVSLKGKVDRVVENLKKLNST